MVDNSETPDHQVRPWTIKGIRDEVRNAVIAAAEREKQSLGEYASRAFLAKIQSDRNQDRLPVPIGQTVGLAQLDHQTGLSEVERIASSMRDLAAAGVPVAKSHASAVTRALVRLLPGKVDRGVDQ